MTEVEILPPTADSSDDSFHKLKRGRPSKAERPFGRTMRVAYQATKSSVGEIITPRELIENVLFQPGESPRLAARRTLFLLVETAAGDAWRDVTHRVTKGQLGQDHKSREDVEALLQAVDQIRLAFPALSSRGRVALEYIGLFDLLRVEVDGGADAWVEFRFRPEIRGLFAASQHYAILNRHTLWRLECRYALTLYVLGCLFVGRHTPTVAVTAQELANLLGMPDATRWAEIERSALFPAKAELAVWAHFTVAWTTDPVSPRGRQRVRRVTLAFEAKDPAGTVVDGLEFGECDRRTRRSIKGKVVAAINAAGQRRDQELRDTIAADLTAAAEAERAADLADEIVW